MYLNKLLLNDFGKFHNKEINLEPGINVVYGAKNDGKTTIADFEYGMLYGVSAFPETTADDLMCRKPIDRRGFTGKAYIKKDTCTSIVTAALFKIAKTCKQPKCPVTDE